METPPGTLDQRRLTQIDLEKQGLPLDISERLKKVPEVSDLRRDKLTGLAIESDGMRRAITEHLSRNIRDGRSWAHLHLDDDHLKLANDTKGRDFGDLVIISGAAKIGKGIDEVQIAQDVEIIAIKPGYAADEIDLWIFGARQEDLEKLREKLKEVEIPVQTQNPPFTFSVTTTLISSFDDSIKNSLELTREWLKEDSERVAYEFYEEVKQKASDAVHLAKLEKDLQRVEKISPEAEGDTLIEEICREFGDRRVSGEVMRRLLRYVAKRAKSQINENI